MSDPLTRSVVPDYALLRKVGVGSYGEVWLARGVTGSLRAVKIVRRSSFDEDRPYEREFAGLKSFEPVSHARENQLDILHVGRNDAAGFFYYVMELADDAHTPAGPTLSSPEVGVCADAPQVDSYCPRTLKHVLRVAGPLPMSDCVQIGLSLARALEHLHAHGLVHRDIKPSNIIFVRGLPKLADIGLVSGIDATRSFVGTEGYVPPEGPGTPQADIYGLGKVLYELATGKDRLEFPELPAEWRTRPDFGQLLELNEIVNRACDWDPKQRYGDARELRQDLERLQAGKSVKAVRIRHQQMRLAWGLGMAVLVAGLAAAVVLWFSRDGSPRHYVSPDPVANTLYATSHLLLQQNSFQQAAIAYSYLEEAVRRDPRFVDAYYRMFETCWSDWGDRIPPLYNQVENQRLIVSNLCVYAPNSVQYHAANAYLNYSDWHFDRAIEEAARAVQCDPTFLRGHGFYGWISLMTRGDVSLALKELKAAERLDGEDVVTKLHLGVLYYFQRQYPSAIDQFKRVAWLVPNSAGAHGRWGRTCEAYAQQLTASGQYERACAEANQAIEQYELMEIAQGQSVELAKAKYDLQRKALKENGLLGWHQARLDDLKAKHPGDFYDLARMYARLDMAGQALQALENGWRTRDGEMAHLLEDDCWDPLRERPEFKSVLWKMGFKPVTLKPAGASASKRQ